GGGAGAIDLHDVTVAVDPEHPRAVGRHGGDGARARRDDLAGGRIADPSGADPAAGHAAAAAVGDVTLGVDADPAAERPACLAHGAAHARVAGRVAAVRRRAGRTGGPTTGRIVG